MVKSEYFVLLLVATYVCADLYMHNPRGSNDRLNEANTNRNNANRLFDSQNNAKGGYCIGPHLTYYEGSYLSLEWTNQHGCGSNPKMVCNLVIQYMCGSTLESPLTRIRDGSGSTTNTPAATQTDANATDDDTGELTFGMHESLQSYLDCATRKRNMGLYIADRATQGGLTPNRASAIYTRQNNNGNRNGYECAEERDYYPYWHPTQWRDIAILASNNDYCDFYKTNSQNVQAKGACYDQTAENPNAQTAQNNPTECQNAGNTWIMKDSWGLPAPDCQTVPWSRENHLGNGQDGFSLMYNTTLPKKSQLEYCIEEDSCVCVLRMRYNISTIEDGFPDMSRPDSGFVDSSHNGVTNAVNTQDAVLNMTDGSSLQLELAMDTSQFGRTFQDRSHTFKITKRPDGISGTARLYNLNVRGKRGNIVQAYPSVEYDFVPQFLYTRVGDYVHFQWTGCDTNPAGNAGEGLDQTDRSNMVQITSPDHSYPVTDAWIQSNPGKVMFKDAETRIYFATLGQDPNVCLTKSELTGNTGNNPLNCGKLNNASAYFNGGVLRMNKTGTYAYMSTRNHSFTNRDQKGILYIMPLLPAWAIGIVVSGSVVFTASAAVAGAMIYAKSHPHSKIAGLLSKV